MRFDAQHLIEEVRLRRRDWVPPEEKAKAAFIADYRAICEKHQMMVAGFEGSFVVVDWSLMPSAIQLAVIEMLLHDTIYVTEDGGESEAS